MGLLVRQCSSSDDDRWVPNALDDITMGRLNEPRPIGAQAFCHTICVCKGLCWAYMYLKTSQDQQTFIGFWDFSRLLRHLLSFLVLWLLAPFAKNRSVATATNHCYSFHDFVDFAQQILVRMTQIEATSDQLRKIHPALVNIFVRLINFYKKLFTEYMQFSKNDQYQEHWKIRAAFLRFRADTAQATIPEHNFAKNATWSSDIRSQT